jgi:hypothetical protein
MGNAFYVATQKTMAINKPTTITTTVCWPYSPTSATPPSHKPELRRAELADLRSHRAEPAGLKRRKYSAFGSPL